MGKVKLIYINKSQRKSKRSGRSGLYISRMEFKQFLMLG